ncbi:MAG: response regulator [Verrucomicrobia bacterium]|nr:response regulator [Verrucomicrobiota bacterium]
MKNILIVEPDLAFGMSYVRSFIVAGFQPTHVTSGAKALATLNRSRPDVAVLSLRPHDSRTLKLMKEIRSQSQTRALPVVAFARENVGSLMADARSEGATECVVLGPGGAQDLVSAVRRILHSPEVSEKSPAPNARTATPTPALAAPSTPAPPAKATPPARESAPQAAPHEPAPSKEPSSQASNAMEKLKALSRSLVGPQNQSSLPQLLSDLHRIGQDFAAERGIVEHRLAASLLEGLLALIKELSENPKGANSSNLRTIYQAVVSLEKLLHNQPPSAAQPAPQFRILAVDDEPGIRNMIKRALTSAHLISDTAKDATEALELSHRERYDLFLLDISMPGLSGFELCKKLRALAGYKETPMIFVTASDNFESRVRSADSGGNDFIGKPFLPKELAVKVLIHLMSRRTGSIRSAR